MASTYSTYEAKAHFSEILRKVRGGQRVIVSYHGEPVAEIRPLEKEDSLAGRMQALEAAGSLSPSVKPSFSSIQPAAHRPGAYKRFLDSRE
ncbi:MAG: type II toxin-antitoxin system prevent-host-death family antitoxin [Acidobacteria bacterium]|nr:type II toxin-antitoxin system prevent-host-death family antitoxin [Acidobacteriota bacterium]